MRPCPHFTHTFLGNDVIQGDCNTGMTKFMWCQAVNTNLDRGRVQVASGEPADE